MPKLFTALSLQINMAVMNRINYFAIKSQQQVIDN